MAFLQGLRAIAMGLKEDYFKPFRPVVTIRHKDGDPIFLLHDSFHPPTEGPAVIEIDVDLAIGDAGSFNIKIIDPTRDLDPSLVGLGNRVLIQGGRKEEELFNIIQGFCRRVEPFHEDYGLLGYNISGFGSQIIFNERIVNISKSAIRDPASPTEPFRQDPNMLLSALFRDLVENATNIPYGGKSIRDTYGTRFLGTNNIDPKCDTFIPAISEPYVEASQVADNLAEMGGAIWGVTADNEVFLRFPSQLHSGITIKDKPESDLDYDTYPHWTSFIKTEGGMRYSDSMMKEDGYSSVLYSKTGGDIINQSVKSTDEDSKTFFNHMDIAQQFTITSTRLRDISIEIAIHGRGEEAQVPDDPRLTGGTFPTIVFNPKGIAFQIMNDDNNRPGPVRLIANNFYFSDISVQPNDTKFSAGLRFSGNGVFLGETGSIKPGDKAWIAVYGQGTGFWRSAWVQDHICAVPAPNTGFYWYHDGTASSGTIATRQVCDMPISLSKSERQPPLTDQTSGWNVAVGPTYSFKITDSFSHYVQAADDEAVERYGEVESFLPADFITDQNTMNQFLSSNLEVTAKPKRVYELSKVTIPNGAIFRPGYLVNIIDEFSGHTKEKNISAEIQEVRWHWSAESDDPLGTRTVEIRPLGYLDFRTDLIV